MPRPRTIPKRAPHRVKIPFRPPFRLDFTVEALRRMPQNRVDLLNGPRYVRAFETPRGPIVWEIHQGDDALDLALYGPIEGAAPYRDLVLRMLAPTLDLHGFESRARRIRGMSALVRRFRGLRPPRFSSIWEAILNAIPFQQLSLISALASLGRLIEGLSAPVEFDGLLLYPLPSPESLANLSEAEVKTFGFSGAKARALLSCARAILDGSLRDEDLEPLETAALEERLLELRGVGPWTAALLMLRGFRRLEIFPAGDSGAARGLAETFPDADPEDLLSRLGPFRGMLYFHLLLSRGHFESWEDR